MALKRNETYPGRFNNPTTDHPQGAFKNRTAPSAQDGSYLEQDWANDWDGFFGRLLTVAGITPNGDVDTALASQYYDALASIFIAGTVPISKGGTGATTAITARTNLGLGTAAIANVGTGTNDVPNTSQSDDRYKLKKWISPGQTMVSNTPTIVNHGLTIDPDLCVLSIRLKCLIANNGYSVGDYSIGFGPRYPSTTTGIAPGSLGALLTSSYVQYNSGPSGDLVTLKSSGGNAPVDYSQWALEFRILYQ